MQFLCFCWQSCRNYCRILNFVFRYKTTVWSTRIAQRCRRSHCQTLMDTDDDAISQSSSNSSSTSSSNIPGSREAKDSKDSSGLADSDTVMTAVPSVTQSSKKRSKPASNREAEDSIVIWCKKETETNNQQPLCTLYRIQSQGNQAWQSARRFVCFQGCLSSGVRNLHRKSKYD